MSAIWVVDEENEELGNHVEYRVDDECGADAKHPSGLLYTNHHRYMPRLIERFHRYFKELLGVKRVIRPGTRKFCRDTVYLGLPHRPPRELWPASSTTIYFNYLENFDTYNVMPFYPDTDINHMYSVIIRDNRKIMVAYNARTNTFVLPNLEWVSNDAYIMYILGIARLAKKIALGEIQLRQVDWKAINGMVSRELNGADAYLAYSIASMLTEYPLEVVELPPINRAKCPGGFEFSFANGTLEAVFPLELTITSFMNSASDKVYTIKGKAKLAVQARMEVNTHRGERKVVFHVTPYSAPVVLPNGVRSQHPNIHPGNGAVCTGDEKLVYDGEEVCSFIAKARDWLAKLLSVPNVGSAFTNDFIDKLNAFNLVGEEVTW